MRRSAPPLDPLLARAVSLERCDGVALLVRALAPHLARPVDRSLALALAAQRDRDDDASPEARLVETLARLHAQLQLNRIDPRGWTVTQRLRVFDPDWLVRRCVGEKLLAAAAHRAWRDAASRLRDAGEDVAALAWSTLTGARPPRRPVARVSAAG